VAVALVHHPVRDRRGATVTTSITASDVHDISRIAKTFGAEPYYIVTPVEAQRDMVETIARHWTQGEGRRVDHPRVAAIESIRVVPSLGAAVEDLAGRLGGRPVVAVTGAWLDSDVTRFADFRRALRSGSFKGVLVVFGTGWGLTPEVTCGADVRIEPIDAGTGFRHLPVRAAVAIVLDRLLGPGV
jgi:hypothetical protein